MFLYTNNTENQAETAEFWNLLPPPKLILMKSEHNDEEIHRETPRGPV